jgi:hypothetical protein
LNLILCLRPLSRPLSCRAGWCKSRAFEAFDEAAVCCDKTLPLSQEQQLEGSSQ